MYHTAPPRLTIGMACYEDFNGVYFSIQALRMFHPEILDEVEFLVVDNNPKGRDGEAVRDFVTMAFSAAGIGIEPRSLESERKLFQFSGVTSEAGQLLSDKAMPYLNIVAIGRKAG